MKVSYKFRCLFLFLLVLTIYFPSINSVINSVDDVHIIREYGVNGQRTLQQILLPGNQFYFRPIIELSYFLDNLLWNLDPSFMHLENVLIHAMNVFLVYLVAVEISVLTGVLTGLPFLSALLFAIHPINTEAVNWIAGRTDPLAAFFILVSALFLLKAFQSCRKRDVFIAFTSMLIAMLVKETSFMLLPVSILLVYSVKFGDETASAEMLKIRKWITSSYLAFLGFFGIYVATRLLLKPAGSNNAFSMMFQNSFDLTSLVRDLLITPGFYLTKLFIPFPLNFAINSIGIWYVVPGIITVLSCSYAFRNRNIVNSLFVTSALFILPAVVVKFTGITWTPVAERYLYIPSAFFSIWLSVTIIRLISYSNFKKNLNAVLILIVCCAAVLTFTRNLVWRDNLTLYRDAVSKSPKFGDIHNELGIALLRNGDPLAARKHFILALQLSKRPLIREFAELNLLNCNLYGKTKFEQREIIREYVASRNGVQPGLLLMLRAVSHQILQAENDSHIKIQLMKEIIALNDCLFRETHDPHCLYSNGQLSLALGNKGTALEYFHRVLVSAPPEAYYFEPAKKLIHQLEK